MILFVVQQSLCVRIFSLGFPLSMLDYCINCSSRVDTEIYSGRNVKKIQLVNKCHEICLMSTCVQTKV